MADVHELLHTLAFVDRRAAVWCACVCARTVLPLVDDGEDRPERAIETAIAWVHGEATKDECARAASASFTAIGTGITAAAKAAAHTASRAAFGGAGHDLICVVDAATRAHAAVGASRERYLAALLGLVCAERWPLTVPTMERLHFAPQGIQVAWDAVSDSVVVGLSILELLEAYERAERLGLDWDDPVQSAVAERAIDEARVRALLAAAPPDEALPVSRA